MLGNAQIWAPSLVEFRLSSASQKDWKTEVGCWLLLARDLGFLDPLRKRVARASTAPRPVDAGTDCPYTLLQHELAAATAAYYFTGIGWRFESWEQRGEGLDIDLRLRATGGTSATGLYPCTSVALGEGVRTEAAPTWNRNHAKQTRSRIAR